MTDPAPPRPWTRFAEELADALSHLGEEQYLVLEVLREDVAPDGTVTRSDSCPFVQFVQGGDEGMRSEAVSNVFLSPSNQLTVYKTALNGDSLVVTV